MKIITAGEEHIETVRYITHTTIKQIYPRYYPKGVVEFFLECNNLNNIKNSVSQRHVYIIEENGVFLGTGSITANEIYRMYVLPEHQHKGFGSLLMNYLERKIFADYPVVMLAASLPAYDFYYNRGYRPAKYFKYITDSGDILCYHIMKLKKKTDYVNSQLVRVGLVVRFF